MRALLAATAVLALAACGKPAATPAAPAPVVSPPPMAAVAPPATPVANAPVIITSYLCAGGRTLEAGYPSPTTALVIYLGQAYTLTQAPAASGARYTGLGLQWWSKGVTAASLATLKPGEDLASDPGMACMAQLGPVTPPAPGAPGGLAAGGAPLPEAAFGPTSPQGAANVVQTYYALLEKRSSVEAARFRVDGSPENLSQYSTIHAQVGVPGAIQGAGATLSVEVPVVLSGRLADGSAFRKSGKAVLRRANDTPGSTSDQLTWRIDRIDVK